MRLEQRLLEEINEDIERESQEEPAQQEPQGESVDITRDSVSAKIQEYGESDTHNTETVERIIYEIAHIDNEIDRSALISQFQRHRAKHGLLINDIRRMVRSHSSDPIGALMAEARPHINEENMKLIMWDTDEQGEPKQPGYFSDEVFANINNMNEEKPFLFVNKDILVEVPKSNDGINVVTNQRLTSILADAFDWKTTAETSTGTVDRNLRTVPDHIPDAIQNHRWKTTKLPRLTHIVNRPVFLDDGTLVNSAGYVQDKGIYITESHDITLLDSVDAAVGTLLEPFQHFQFKETANMANAFAFLFTIIMREHIDGNVPLFPFIGSTPGTGKGLLCDTLHYIANGIKLARTHFSRSEDIFERRIASGILKGISVIFIDNIRDGWNVDDPYLEMLATAEEVSVKILYQTLEKSIENRSVVAITGNNLSFSRGLSRRIQKIVLTTDVERPELRELPNLTQQVKQDRSQILSAVLTIANEWFATGKPIADINYGSFEEWARIIGGILEIAGIDGFDPTQTTLSNKEVAVRNFVKAVWEYAKTYTWTSKEVEFMAYDVEDHEYEHDTPRQILTETLSNRTLNSLSYLIRQNLGRTFEFSEDDFEQNSENFVGKLTVKQLEGTSPLRFYLIPDGLGGENYTPETMPLQDSGDRIEF